MSFSINWKMLAIVAFIGVTAYGVWAGILPVDEVIRSVWDAGVNAASGD